jgi:very-short-patch-repair endonuclease
MPIEEIVTNQRVSKDKLFLAKELRKEMTPAEAVLWQHLRHNRLAGYHFRRQQLIRGFIVDFYCHHVSLVIEIDGGIHADQPEYDAEREVCLTDLGLRVLRFRNEEVLYQLESVCQAIQDAINAPTPEMKAPLPFREGAGG